MNDTISRAQGRVRIIRASSLPQFADCARRWAANNITDEVEDAGFKLNERTRNIGAAIGTSVHKAGAMMLAEKARTGNLPPTSVSDDAAIDALRTEASFGEMITDRETPNLNDGEQQVIRMARVYREQVCPQIEPLIVEERLEAQVSPLIALSGQADVIAREPGKILDLKTGKKKGNHNAQLGAYSLLARTQGLDITEAATDFIQRVPLKKPQPGHIRDERAIATVESAAINTMRHIEGDLTVFREGNVLMNVMPGDPWAFQANPSSILCSRKWCPAFGTEFCREHAPEKEAEES